MNTSKVKKAVLVGGLVASTAIVHADWDAPAINDSAHWWAQQTEEGNVVRDWGSQFDKEWRSQETEFALGSATNWGGRRNQSFKNKAGDYDGRAVFMGDTRGVANNDGYLTLRCGWLPSWERFTQTYTENDGTKTDYTVQWYSGYFRSKEKMGPGYFYEARFKTTKFGSDSLLNLSNAFWFRDSNGPEGPAEIDVTENVPNNWNGEASANLHPMTGLSLGYHAWVGNNNTNWHTYGLLWQPDKLEWFCDGNRYRSMWKSSSDPLTYTFSDGITVTGENADKIYYVTRTPQYLIFDMEALLGAIPGSFEDKLDANFQDMRIDYVARFKIK